MTPKGESQSERSMRLLLRHEWLNNRYEEALDQFEKCVARNIRTVWGYQMILNIFDKIPEEADYDGNE